MAAQSSPMRTGASPHGPRRTAGRWRAAAWMSRLCWRPSAAASVAASSGSMVQPPRPRLVDRRVARELGLHQVMGLAMQLQLAERSPVQAAKERDVRPLYGGAELVRAPGTRGAHRRAYQRAAEGSQRAELRVHAEAAAPPDAGGLLPDAHDTAHPPGRVQADDTERVVVDGVAIVAGKDALLVAEDLPAEREVA